MSRAQRWAAAVGVGLVLAFTVMMYFTTHSEEAPSRDDRVADACAQAVGVGNTEALARCIVLVEHR